LAAKPGQETFGFDIRIEEGNNAKKFNFNGPKELLANLLWFQRLTSIGETSHLRRLDADGNGLTVGQ
jgi:hypothetical protein